MFSVTGGILLGGLLKLKGKKIHNFFASFYRMVISFFLLRKEVFSKAEILPEKKIDHPICTAGVYLDILERALKSPTLTEVLLQ